MKQKNFIKIMTFLTLIALLSTSLFLPCLAAASERTMGDVNLDGKIDVVDCTMIKSVILKKNSESILKNRAAADMNNDGLITAADYLLLKKMLMEGQVIIPIKIPITGSGMDTSSIKTKYLDVPYGSVSKTQTLDIYLPNEGSGPFPVIVAIHGGAFLGGSSKGTEIPPMLEGGINHGYAVVSLNYRLSPEAKFPAGVSDVKAAVRFIRANASKYKFNTDKIAAWGFSSGGFLVSMLGTTGNVSTLNGDTKDNLNYSSDVKAVVDWSGHIDFLTMDDQFRASGLQSAFGNTNDASSPASQLMGQPITKDPAFTERANPETYISTMTAATAPAFLIQHGSSDNIVPCQQSINFAAKLKQAIGENKVTLDIINGAGHGSGEFYAPNNIEKIFAFLNGALK